VAPVALCGIFGIGVLSVVDEQVGTGQPLHVAAIAWMKQSLGGARLALPPERLVISGVDDANTPRFHAIAQAGSGMVKILGADRDPANTKGALAHLVNSDLGSELAQSNRKVGVLHLPRECVL
jgi:hypothetical protein